MPGGDRLHTDRYVMALYYAYGRRDATCRGATTIPATPEAIPFAEFYTSLWDEFQRGQSSHMPSVQDAWDQYRRMQAVRA